MLDTDHTQNAIAAAGGVPIANSPWSVKRVQKAKYSCVKKFLLVESSQPRSSVVRASAAKVEYPGFDSRAGQTLFA